MMKDGQFRKDLYFRLGVIKVKVPSLNQRPDDIMPLAKHFLKEFSDKLGKGLAGISSEAQEALMQHTWTGNVRELKNVMEAAAIVSNRTELMLVDLAASFQVAIPDIGTSPAQTDIVDFPVDGFCLVSMLEGIERKYIQNAMEHA
jgi:two-component system response regulator AtoC